MSDIPNNNGWSEWENHVLLTLERLEKAGGKRDIILNKLVTDIRVMQTRMTIRAALSGALSAAIPVTIGLIIWFITKNPSP
jgi:hypothetical protein